MNKNIETIKFYFEATIAFLISLGLSIHPWINEPGFNVADVNPGTIWCICMPTIVLTYFIYKFITFISLLFSYIGNYLRPSYIDTSYCQQFYVEYLPRHTKQKADIEVIHKKQFKRKGNKLFYQEDHETIYILKTLYWKSSGGRSHYFNSSPILEVGKEIEVTTDDNKVQRLKFTGELYEPEPPKSIPQKEYEEYRERCKNAKQQTINEINKVFKDKIDFESAASMITDYHYRLNLAISDNMVAKKHPASISAYEVKRISKKTKRNRNEI